MIRVWYYLFEKLYSEIEWEFIAGMIAFNYNLQNIIARVARMKIQNPCAVVGGKNRTTAHWHVVRGNLRGSRYGGVVLGVQDGSWALLLVLFVFISCWFLCRIDRPHCLLGMAPWIAPTAQVGEAPMGWLESTHPCVCYAWHPKHWCEKDVLAGEGVHALQCLCFVHQGWGCVPKPLMLLWTWIHWGG